MIHLARSWRRMLRDHEYDALVTETLGHAAAAMRRGEIERCMILSKASLFLGRCTELFDGVSLLIEKNPGLRGPETTDG